MKVTTLTVIGDPLLCGGGRGDCQEPATVLLRHVDHDGDDAQMLYCDACWLAARRAYVPNVARDEQEAVRAADALTKAERRSS